MPRTKFRKRQTRSRRSRRQNRSRRRQKGGGDGYIGFIKTAVNTALTQTFDSVNTGYTIAKEFIKNPKLIVIGFNSSFTYGLFNDTDKIYQWLDRINHLNVGELKQNIDGHVNHTNKKTHSLGFAITKNYKKLYIFRIKIESIDTRTNNQTHKNMTDNITAMLNAKDPHTPTSTYKGDFVYLMNADLPGGDMSKDEFSNLFLSTKVSTSAEPTLSNNDVIPFDTDAVKEQSLDNTSVKGPPLDNRHDEDDLKLEELE